MNCCYHHSPQGLKTKLSDKVKKNYKSQRKQLKAGQFLLIHKVLFFISFFGIFRTLVCKGLAKKLLKLTFLDYGV